MESSFRYAELSNDEKVLDKITILEKELSDKTGKKNYFGCIYGLSV